MPGRFSLGVGTGENLNEHILGGRWPGVVERQARLEEAIEVIRELWEGKLVSQKVARASGSYFLELPLPAHFEEAAEILDEEDIAESVVCGPDPERHRAAIEEYVDAGYDHVYVHQIGPDQEDFFEFYEREVLPGFS